MSALSECGKSHTSKNLEAQNEIQKQGSADV